MFIYFVTIPKVLYHPRTQKNFKFLYIKLIVCIYIYFIIHIPVIFRTECAYIFINLYILYYFIINLYCQTEIVEYICIWTATTAGLVLF